MFTRKMRRQLQAAASAGPVERAEHASGLRRSADDAQHQGAPGQREHVGGRRHGDRHERPSPRRLDDAGGHEEVQPLARKTQSALPTMKSASATMVVGRRPQTSASRPNSGIATV